MRVGRVPTGRRPHGALRCRSEGDDARSEDPLGFMEPGFTEVLKAQVEEAVEERSAEAVQALEAKRQAMVDEYRAEVEAQGRSMLEEVTRDGERSAASAEAAADRALDRLRAARAEADAAEAAMEAARKASAGSASASPSDAALSDADRLESVKAGLICGAVGVACTAPLALGSAGDPLYALALPLGSAALTAALFGIVLRYAVAGGPPNNTHLPWGVVGAFALTQGLAYVQGYLAGNPGAGPAEGVTLVVNVVEAFLLFSIVSLALARATEAGVVSRAGERTDPPP